ncbi:hypothetical protein COBT_000943 [Conglomerata obtusa]
MNVQTTKHFDLKDLVFTTFSIISYLRDFFPETSYITSSVCGIPVKELSPNTDPNAQEFLSWIKNGIFDAISKQYLKTFSIGIYLKDPCKIVETYSFEISYNENVEQHGTESVAKLVRTLCLLVQSLQPLPRIKYVTVKLTYVEHVPIDYEPPCFKMSNCHKFEYVSEPLRLDVGIVKTGRDQTVMRIHTLYDYSESKNENNSIEKNTAKKYLKEDDSDNKVKVLKEEIFDDLNINVVQDSANNNGTNFSNDKKITPDKNMNKHKQRSKKEENNFKNDVKVNNKNCLDKEFSQIYNDNKKIVAKNIIEQKLHIKNDMTLLATTKDNIKINNTHDTNQRCNDAKKPRKTTKHNNKDQCKEVNANKGDQGKELTSENVFDGIEPNFSKNLCFENNDKLSSKENVKTNMLQENNTNLNDYLCKLNIKNSIDEKINKKIKMTENNQLPKIKKPENYEINKNVKEEIHRCICNVNVDDGDMLLCDKCNSWLHTVCCGFFSNQDKRIPKNDYVCEFCKNECRPEHLRKIAMYRRALSVIYNEGFIDEVNLSTRLGFSVPCTKKILHKFTEEGFVVKDNKEFIVVKDSVTKLKIKQYFSLQIRREKASSPIKDIKCIRND